MDTKWMKTATTIIAILLFTIFVTGCGGINGTYINTQMNIEIKISDFEYEITRRGGGIIQGTIEEREDGLFSFRTEQSTSGWISTDLETREQTPIPDASFSAKFEGNQMQIVAGHIIKYDLNALADIILVKK